jgi:hypothetical protein
MYSLWIAGWENGSKAPFDSTIVKNIINHKRKKGAKEKILSPICHFCALGAEFDETGLTV